MENGQSKFLHISPPKQIVWAVVAFLSVATLLLLVQLKNEARGATIDKEKLISFFTEVKLPKPIRAINFDDLTYNLTGYKYDGPDGQLKITGEVEFESVSDTAVIQKFVSEKRITKSKDILTAFSQLASVEVRFRPFWFKYPPTNPNRIDIILPLR